MNNRLIPAVAIACLLIAAPNALAAAAKPGSIGAAATAETPQELYDRATKIEEAATLDALAKALKLHRQAAERGHGQAMFHLAEVLSNQYGETNAYNRDEALKWARKAEVSQGDVTSIATSSSFKVAEILRQDGTTAEAREAVAILERLAAAGEANAVNELANLWDMGVGEALPADQWKATAWRRKAAETGDVGSMVAYADRLAEGKGTPIDGPEALRWYRKAADAKDPNGMAGLAKLLRLGGPGVERRPAEAAEWARKLVGQDVLLGFKMLGEMYEEGDGLPQDYTQARAWLRKAHERDTFLPNPIRLARLYEKGLGGPADPVMAYAYYAVCSGNTADASAKRLLASFDKATRARAEAAAKKLKK